MMRLSEAIRLGSLLHPQGFGQYRMVNGDIVTTCALGAAMEAAGMHEDTSEPNHPQWYAWRAMMSPPPCSCKVQRKFSMLDMVIHLNDHHGWTREDIADWVEAREREDDARVQARRASLNRSHSASLGLVASELVGA